jgi:hypothetical protein
MFPGTKKARAFIGEIYTYSYKEDSSLLVEGRIPELTQFEVIITLKNGGCEQLWAENLVL